MRYPCVPRDRYRFREMYDDYVLDINYTPYEYALVKPSERGYDYFEVKIPTPPYHRQDKQPAHRATRNIQPKDIFRFGAWARGGRCQNRVREGWSAKACSDAVEYQIDEEQLLQRGLSYRRSYSVC